MEEKLVGIETYLSEGKPFPFLVKLKFSDFIVNEISKTDQKVLFISDTSQWKDFDKVKLSHKEFLEEKNEKAEKLFQDKHEKIIQATSNSSAFEKFELSEDFLKEGEQLFGKEVLDKIIDFVEMIKMNDNPQKFEVKIPLPEDKDKRIRIHTLVRNHLPFFETQSKTSANLKKNQKNQKLEEKLQQQTATDDTDVNYILIKLNVINFKKFKSSSIVAGSVAQKSGDQSQQQKSIYQKERKKMFLNFLLMKRNLDTINAGIIISKFLSISNKHFGYAGIKDKRGITTQQCTLQGITMDQLLDIQQRKNWNQNMVLSDFHYSDDGFRLGDLYGNRFSIALRLTIKPTIQDRWDIIHNIQNLKEHGFINFYGLQRFGMNRKVKTHEIGREILRNNWKQAFENILLSSCSNDPNLLLHVQQFMIDFDVNKLMKILPVKLRIEKILLSGLEGQNFLNAIMKLPRLKINIPYIIRNVREIYAHAYQSYIWNKLASRRIQQFGRQPVIGDLVLAKGDVKDEDICEDEEHEGIDEEALQKQQIDSSEIIILNETNILNYESKDIVLPIYGSKTVIPNDSILSQLLQQIFLEEGISPKDFEQAQKLFYLEGGFRYMIQIPEQFEYEIVYYNDREQELVSPFYNIEKINHNEEGQYMAVLIKMNLRKSCYATMLIRELTKETSSLDYQQELNDQYRQL